MAGRPFYEHSIDAGDAWTLHDAYGHVVTTWDGRGFQIDRAYDLGDRPLSTKVKGGDGAAPLHDRVVEVWAYGESLGDPADAARRNLFGRRMTSSDSAGQVSVDHYDPPGHVLSSTRQLRLLTDIATEPSYPASATFEQDQYTTSAMFDALGRPTTDTLPDGTVRAFEYLPSGPLARVRVTTPDGTLSSTAILDGTAYGARGERRHVKLGNGVEVAYGYDAVTRRLSTQTAKLGTQSLQAISYVYDPVGNLVRLTDAAQQGPSPTISGATAPGRRDYTYDAHYRLLTATGRVHQALLQYDYVPTAAGTFMGTRQVGLNDRTAIEQFRQKYAYDASGNMLSLKHVGQSQSWTTTMWVSQTSNRSMPLYDPGDVLVQSPDGRFDAGGNLVQVAHLRAMEWTFRGALGHAVVTRRDGAPDDDERYVYGADGVRVRKVTTRVVNGQAEVTEKVYLGDAERRTVTLGGKKILERWTVHVRDGEQRVALVHRWVQDDLKREVDSVPQVKVHYQLNTHQGSSAMELDESGGVISYEEYLPHGGTAFIAGDDVRAVGLKEYRYSGKECDAVTGLYYYGHRSYASWMGRWASPDPIGPEDDLNLYQFVHGDPVGRTDDQGLRSPEPLHKAPKFNFVPAMPAASTNALQACVPPECFLMPSFTPPSPAPHTPSSSATPTPHTPGLPQPAQHQHHDPPGAQHAQPHALSPSPPDVAPPSAPGAAAQPESPAADQSTTGRIEVPRTISLSFLDLFGLPRAPAAPEPPRSPELEARIRRASEASSGGSTAPHEPEPPSRLASQVVETERFNNRGFPLLGFLLPHIELRSAASRYSDPVLATYAGMDERGVRATGSATELTATAAGATYLAGYAAYGLHRASALVPPSVWAVAGFLQMASARDEHDLNLFLGGLGLLGSLGSVARIGEEAEQSMGSAARIGEETEQSIPRTVATEGEASAAEPANPGEVSRAPAGLMPRPAREWVLPGPDSADQSTVIHLGETEFGEFRQDPVGQVLVDPRYFAEHIAMRAAGGMGAMGAEGAGTLARLEVNGERFWGINAYGQRPSLVVNPISATHAETDAFNQAFDQAARTGVRGGAGTLVVDREFCGACGTRGAVLSMARQLGLDSLTIVTPQRIVVTVFAH
jgi:RHS repeat-associated protein